MAGERDAVLRERQRLAGRDAQLPLDEVEPGDHFRHRMFDLQPRVHFQEIETLVGGEKEFHRARTDVIHGLRGGDGGSTHCFAQSRIDRR